MRSACRYFAGFIALAIVSAARAEEGGAGHYAPGSFASFVDVLPSKPSLGVFNYFTYYERQLGRQPPVARRRTDRLKRGRDILRRFVGRILGHTVKILGAYYAPGVALPLVWTNVTAQVTLPGGRTASRSESVSGLGDMEYWPVALSWSAFSGDLHVDFLGGIYAPTGEFRKNRLADQGLGYFDL